MLGTTRGTSLVQTDPARRVLPAALAAMMAITLAVAAPADAATGPDATYEVTITDLTGGQPLTPPVVALHRGPSAIFTVGSPASDALREVAENGNLAPLLGELADDPRVVDVATAAEPLVPAGTPGGATFDDQVTLTLSGSQGARFISFASMLICTNDGFTGIDRGRLPVRPGESTTFVTAGYDAGTEVNTEDFADIVPPCQGLIGVTSDDTGTGTSDPALAEGGVVHHHPNISGIDDLVPAVHGWADPVAEVVVTRTG